VVETRTASSVKTDWAEVYRSTYREMLRFLHRKVWDEERAKDLVQEAFVRAIGHDPENPRAWIFQVAANLARDEARSVVRRKRHLTLLRVEADEAGASAPTPAAELEGKEAADRLRTALETLSVRDRDALLLWDAGLSYTEIARQTGLAQGAVGTTLARAKKRLVEMYDALEGRDAALG
jgi:RNA polymerase sigma-70 factor (ECF subfamily)